MEKRENVLIIKLPPIISTEIIARRWYFNNHLTRFANITFYHMINGKCLGFNYKTSKYVVRESGIKVI